MSKQRFWILLNFGLIACHGDGMAQTCLIERSLGPSNMQVLNMQTGEFVAFDGIAGGEPCISPDRTKFAFTAGNPYSVYVADIDGSDIRKVSPPLGLHAEFPSWSEDSSRLVFSFRYPNHSEWGKDLWVVNSDGSAPRSLFQGPEDDRKAKWSPDGEWIAFIRGTSQEGRVMMIRPNGADLHQFAFGGSVAWSPDGRWLAVGTPSSVQILDRMGTSLVQFATGSGVENLCFTPDMSRLIVDYYFSSRVYPVDGAGWVTGGGRFPSCPINEPGFIYPYEMNVTKGDEIRRFLSDLWKVDGNCSKIFSASEDQSAGASFHGLNTFPQGTTLRLEFAAWAEKRALAQIVSVFDYDLGRFRAIDGRVAPTSPAMVEVDLSASRASLVNPDRQMGAKVEWSPINDEDPAQDGWMHQIDMFRWVVS